MDCVLLNHLLSSVIRSFRRCLFFNGIILLDRSTLYLTLDKINRLSKLSRDINIEILNYNLICTIAQSLIINYSPLTKFIKFCFR